MTNTETLEARVRQLEDRVAISETVIKYARAIDLADWELFASVFTDPVHIDFSDAGMPPGDLARNDFVGFAAAGLSGFDGRQHLSPNHLIEFDPADPDRAVCFSYMYAQHYLADGHGGDFYLMRGSYTNRMLRTSEGWKITNLTQHLSWLEGNKDLPRQAGARTEAAQPTG